MRTSCLDFAGKSTSRFCFLEVKKRTEFADSGSMYFTLSLRMKLFIRDPSSSSIVLYFKIIIKVKVCLVSHL